MSLLERLRAAPMVQYCHLKVGDVIWIGRHPDDRRVRVQLDRVTPDGAFGVFFLNGTGLYGDLLQEPEEGAIYLRSPSGELSRPLYIVEKMQ
jgi:hypothetical protein